MQQFAGHISAGGRDAQTKGFLGYKIGLRQASIERSMHHGPSVLQTHALTYAKHAACPTRIHQPALSIVVAQAITKHLGVHLGRKRQKWRTEASRKLRHRFAAQSRLRSGELRRVS